MTKEELQTLLSQLGVVSYNNYNVAPCRVCQPEETEPEAFKLYVSPGKSLPVLLFCMRCCVPKAIDEEDKKNNKRIVYYNIIQSKIQPSTFYTPMDEDSIHLIWENQKLYKPVESFDRADDPILHHCYSDLLQRLTLNERHAKWLQRRGLDPQTFFSKGYRSTPTKIQSKQYAQELYTKSGRQICDKVPGLTESHWLTREGALLIPCRDSLGRIGALKQRLMQEGAARMRLLSGDGTKAKQMLHYPLGSKVQKGYSLWVTEGERKADVLYDKLQYSVVGVPGTGTIERVIEPAIEAGNVVLAFDKDEAGAKAACILAKRLLDKGIYVQLAKWDIKYKKIDDAIVNNIKIDLVGVNHSWFPQWRKIEKSYPKSDILWSEATVLAYIREQGQVLRESVKAHPATISNLIRLGKVIMTKTKEGQVLSV